MLRKYILLAICSIAMLQAQGQTKDESIKWLVSKLNAYGYRPLEKISEGIKLTPLTEWTYNKGALQITVKKVDKSLTAMRYEYSIPLYAIDSVDFNNESDGKTRPGRYLRMYLNCKCAAYKYHEIVSGGGMIDERVGKTDKMDVFMLGNEEKDIKDRMNKALAYLRMYFPKPTEAF